MLSPEPTTLPSLLHEVLGQDVTALTQCNQVCRGVGKGCREGRDGAVKEAIPIQISSEAGIAQKLYRLASDDKTACNKTKVGRLHTRLAI